MEASGSGNPEMVTFLLEQHANINYADPKMGYTALHAAADVGGRDRVGVVRVLLAHGATLSIRDKKRADAAGHRTKRFRATIAAP